MMEGGISYMTSLMAEYMTLNLASQVDDHMQVGCVGSLHQYSTLYIV